MRSGSLTIAPVAEEDRVAAELLLTRAFAGTAEERSRDLVRCCRLQSCWDVLKALACACRDDLHGQAGARRQERRRLAAESLRCREYVNGAEASLRKVLLVVRLEPTGERGCDPAQRCLLPPAHALIFMLSSPKAEHCHSHRI